MNNRVLILEFHKYRNLFRGAMVGTDFFLISLNNLGNVIEIKYRYDWQWYIGFITSKEVILNNQRDVYRRESFRLNMIDKGYMNPPDWKPNGVKAEEALLQFMADFVKEIKDGPLSQSF